MPDSKIIHGIVKQSDLVSPYLSGVLNLYSKSIHWETTRGCPFRCGFCEWGNASDKKPVRLSLERLDREIELFRRNHVGHVNILDATFNSGPSYIRILENLLSIPGLKITCQARFENLLKEHGAKFLELCQENPERIHLEFGLQTIHENEMELIGRKNNLMLVKEALRLLKEKGISYETSLIYAIPGQTPLSFIDSIEFLLNHGCTTIRAYPLRIPANSRMDKIRVALGIESTRDAFTVESVGKSSSFSRLHRGDMDAIAQGLCDGKPILLPWDRVKAVADVEQVSNFQWRIRKTNNMNFAKLIISLAIGTLATACYEIQQREGKLMSLAAVGALAGAKNDPLRYANQLLQNQIQLTPASMFGLTATFSKSGRLYVFGDEKQVA